MAWDGRGDRRDYCLGDCMGADMNGEQQHVVSAESVKVLGACVGNLWDIFIDGVRWRRYSYHGDALVHVVLKQRPSPAVGYWPSKGEIEAAIDRLYQPEEQSDV
jgi:hypothetical protein